jgi:hypothetical protein
MILAEADAARKKGTVDEWERATTRAESALPGYVLTATESGASNAELHAASHPLFR